MKKKTLLQIDSCLGILSTGRIVESIGRLAQSQGWECYAAHSARFVGPSKLTPIKVGSKWSEYTHFIKTVFWDNHGLNSIDETKSLVKKIEEIKPDIIQLHCIHGYYLNYKVLFEYLNTTQIPIVWTFHDCWAFTGHCSHFVSVGCDKWKTGCYDCELKREYPRSYFRDNSITNYGLKKSLFTAPHSLTVVPASYWMEDLVRQSFFGNRENIDICTIHNGVDISIFCNKDTKSIGRTRIKYNISQNKRIVLGCSSIWSQGKGLYDFYKLRNLLPSDIAIVLVGLNDSQIKDLPKNIIGVKHTDSIEELAALYNLADVFVNPTYADTFPTVNLEALACGTPVVTYKTGGSPEAVDEYTGLVCKQGGVSELAECCMKILSSNPDIRMRCRKRAELLFNRDKCFQQYIDLYDRLLEKNK